MGCGASASGMQPELDGVGQCSTDAAASRGSKKENNASHAQTFVPSVREAHHQLKTQEDETQEELEQAFGATVEQDVATTKIQAAHRGHMGRVNAKKKKTSLAISHMEPQFNFYAQESGLANIELNIIFKALKSKAEDGGVTADGFVEAMTELGVFKNQGEVMMRGLFKALDTSSDGRLSLEELSSGILLFTSGSRADKLACCFSVYDADDSGFISRDELTRLFKTEVVIGLKAIQGALEFDLIEAAADGSDAKVDVSENVADGSVTATAKTDENNQVKVAVQTSCATGTAAVDVQSVIDASADSMFADLRGDQIVEGLVNQVFSEADKDKDDKVTLAEFTAFVKKHPQLTSWFDILSA